MDKWIQRFLFYLRAERNASPHTLRAYQHDLSGFLAFVQAKYPGLPVERNQRIVVRDYLSELHGRNIQRATISRAVAVLRAFYKYLMREEAVGQTPFIRLPMPKRPKFLPRFLTEEEMSRLLDLPVERPVPSSLRDGALLELLYSSGLRIQELCRLNIEDIDFWGRRCGCLEKEAASAWFPPARARFGGFTPIWKSGPRPNAARGRFF